MIGDYGEDDDSSDNNEVLIKNIKCEVCKNIPKDICTCESCNKYYCKNCTKGLDYCVSCGAENPEFKENGYLRRILQAGVKIIECEFCHDFFLEKDLTEHKCKVPHYTCKCCRQYATTNEKEFWDHLITNHKEEFVKELDLNN